MGIINPRPAMRAKEERNLRSTLLAHHNITVDLIRGGLGPNTASKIAFDIIKTRNTRKKIWRTK